MKNVAFESPDGSLCNNLGLAQTYTVCHAAYNHKHNLEINCRDFGAKWNAVICNGTNPWRTFWIMGVTPS